MCLQRNQGSAWYQQWSALTGLVAAVSDGSLYALLIACRLPYSIKHVPACDTLLALILAPWVHLDVSWLAHSLLVPWLAL